MERESCTFKLSFLVKYSWNYADNGHSFVHNENAPCLMFISSSISFWLISLSSFLPLLICNFVSFSLSFFTTICTKIMSLISSSQKISKQEELETTQEETTDELIKANKQIKELNRQLIRAQNVPLTRRKTTGSWRLSDDSEVEVTKLWKWMLLIICVLTLLLDRRRLRTSHQGYFLLTKVHSTDAEKCQSEEILEPRIKS